MVFMKDQYTIYYYVLVYNRYRREIHSASKVDNQNSILISIGLILSKFLINSVYSLEVLDSLKITVKTLKQLHSLSYWDKCLSRF